MKTKFKSIKKWLRWALLMSGLAVAIMGITLFFVPVENLDNISAFIGVAIMISAICELVSFCNRKSKRHYGFMLGIVIFGINFGLTLILYPSYAPSVVMYSLAFLFIIQGVNCITVFFKLNKKWDIAHIIESEVF